MIDEFTDRARRRDEARTGSPAEAQQFMAAHRQECIDHDRGHHSWRDENRAMRDVIRVMASALELITAHDGDGTCGEIARAALKATKPTE